MRTDEEALRRSEYHSVGRDAMLAVGIGGGDLYWALVRTRFEGAVAGRLRLRLLLQEVGRTGVSEALLSIAYSTG